MMLLLLELFWTFFLIGLFTVGGGYAVIGVIQSQIVQGKGWITESSFTDIVAISQMTPGPVGLNCSTFVGYEALKQAGAGQAMAVAGSLTASVAIVLPSFIIMLIIVRFYTKFHQTPVFQGVMTGLKPAVAGLIAAAAVVLAVNISLGGGAPEFRVVTDNFPDWKAWAIAAAAYLAYLAFKAGPMLLLGCGAVAGFVIYYLL